MFEVPSSLRATQPYSNIGVIVVTWPDGTRARGTAALVGRNDILTAGHVVYSPDHGGWATAYQFSFGADYNGVTNTYEDVPLRPTFTRWEVAAWTGGLYVDGDNRTMLYSETQYDVALIGIDDPIGDALGWLDPAPGYDGSRTAVAVGYPAGTTGMMAETVTVTASPVWDVYIADRLVMGPGSSGGPLLVGNTVIGVKSTWVSWADLDMLWGELSARMAGNDALIAPDTTAPVVVRWSPAHGAVDVARGANVVVTFSEAIRRGTGAIVLETAAGAVVERFDAATSDRLSISAATLTIDPSAELAPGTAYVVAFEPGSIEDGSGNAYAGTTAYGFRTIGAPTAGDDTLTASATADVVDGLAGDDSIQGLEGDDTLSGGAGDDLLIGGAGDDSIAGGEGTDTAAFTGNYRDYSLSSQYSIDSWSEGRFTLLGYAVTSSSEGRDFIAADVEWLRFADGMAFLASGTVRFLVPDAVGTSAGEALTGSARAEALSAMGGDDALFGGGGDDSLFGGTGFDTAVYSARYADVAIASLPGGGLTKTLAAYRVRSVADGADWVGPDVERLQFADGAVTLGTDAMRFVSSLPALRGTARDDLLEGGDGAEAIYAEAGDDRVIASAGDDHIFGGDGLDVVSYPSAAAFFTVSAAADGSAIVSHATFGTDVLAGVERIRFTDRWYASDTSGSAGVAAKAVVATFGAEALPAYLGSALGLTDRGHSTSSLADLVAEARFVESAIGDDGSSAFVAAVFRNAVGRAPAATEAAFYLGMLHDGSTTRAGLLKLAFEARSTAAAVEEAAVELLGLPYQPVSA